MIASDQVILSVAVQATLAVRDAEETGKHEHPHTLNDIQRRAYRIHQRHGGIYGGYTLEEWLEAEHELDDEQDRQAQKDGQVH